MIIGYSVDDTAEKAKKYAAEYKMNYPILLGEGREDVQDAYGPIWGIPASFIISKDGRVCRKHMGIAPKAVFEKEVVALTELKYDRDIMLKGFEHARLACGCRLAFRDGSAGSPVLVVLETKSTGCVNPRHVSGLPLYDYREALRPSTRLGSLKRKSSRKRIRAISSAN